MSLIKLKLDSAVIESTSAAKKPSYKVAKVGGTQTLVIPSEKKAELQAVVGLLKKAKTAAVAGMSGRIKAATAYTKAKQLPKGPRKTALNATYKTEKTKATAEIKQAKKLISEANSHAKKHGLGGLNLPLSAADIITGPGIGNALKKVRSTKLTEFGLTGKRGTFKPKFVKQAVFDTLGSKTTTKAAAKAKAPVAKAKKPAAKKPATAGGTADAKLGAKVEKRSKAILRTVGAKADFSKASGTITNSEGKSLGNGAGVVVTEMRHHFADKNIPIVRKKDGFEIPGVVSITYSDKGATFKRLGK